MLYGNFYDWKFLNRVWPIYRFNFWFGQQTEFHMLDASRPRRQTSGWLCELIPEQLFAEVFAARQDESPSPDGQSGKSVRVQRIALALGSRPR